MGLTDSHIQTLKLVHPDIAAATSADDPKIKRIVSLLGPTMTEVLFRICRTDDGIEDIERKSKIPARSGKVVIRCALECLR